MIRQVLILLLIIGFVSVLLPNSLEACPACKNLDEPIARGFNWSVLFMMAMPFTVFGVISTLCALKLEKLKFSNS